MDAAELARQFAAKYHADSVRNGLDLSEKARIALNRLAEALGGFDAKAPPWEVLAKVLLNRTRIIARIASSDTLAFGCTHCTPTASPAPPPTSQLLCKKRFGALS